MKNDEIKYSDNHILLDKTEIEAIRFSLYQEANELFSSFLKGGTFAVLLQKDYPFLFISEQLLNEYGMDRDVFYKTYNTGLLSTIQKEERKAYEKAFQNALDNNIQFDLVSKSSIHQKVIFIRDLMKKVTLSDGTQIALILRCNINNRIQVPIEKEHEAEQIVERNKRLEELTVKIPCAVCMLSINEHFTLKFANNEFYRLLKFTENQLKEEKSNCIDALIYPADFKALNKKITKAIQQKDVEIQLENRIVCRDNSVIWLLVKGYFTYTEEYPEMICSFMDITSRKKMEEEMKISEERFKIALSVTESTIFEYDIRTKVMVHGDRSANAYGLQHITENVPETLLEQGTVHPDSADAFRGMYQKIHDGAKTASCLVLANMVGDGYVWRKIIMTNIFDETGHPVQAIGVLEDVDEQVNREKQLIYETERDALTGLYNRRFMVSNIERELMNTTSNNYKAVMIIDIDDFKNVNDNLGHLFGDFVLSESAKRIIASVGDDVFIGRLGGDEFILFYRNLEHSNDVNEYARKIISAFYKQFCHQENCVVVTCSMGYAIFPDDGLTFEELYKGADTALYEAKKAGKNMVVRYEKNMKMTNSYLASKQLR